LKIITIMKKQLILLVIILTSSLSKAYAYDYAIANSDGITIFYNIISDSEHTLSVVRGETLYSGALVLPTKVTIEGSDYTIIKIGEQAFMGCPDLISIIMPESVTEIGAQAFENDYQLETIVFSDNTIIIQENAFYGCKKLTKVTLPPLLSAIAPNTFKNCTELEEIMIPKSVKRIENNNYGNDNPFGGCTKLRKIVLEDLQTWLNISYSGGCQAFESYHLFVGEQEIKDLIIPDGISTIGNYAFQSCTGLESITITENVKSIGRSAFKNCGKIKKLSISGGNHSFGSYSLSGCYPEIIDVPSLEMWMNTISPNIMANGNTIFKYQLIADGTEVESLVIPDGISKVDDRTFCGCISIKTVSFPYTTTSIGYLSFGYCTELESVTIRNGITKVGESAFESCEKLTNVVLPNSIMEISPFCFARCTSLKSIDIPEGITCIAGSAFEGCTSLEEIIMPNSLTTIGGDYDSYDNRKMNHVFSGCISLKRIEIPDNVEYIGSFSFYECSNLTTIKLSDNLKYISRQCFQGCERLNSVTIGSKTSWISYGAFSNCASLQQVICNSQEPPTAETDNWATYPSSFNGINLSNVCLYVPSVVIEQYKSKTPWSSFGTIKEITDGSISEKPQCIPPIITYKNGKLSFSCETEGVTFCYKVTTPSSIENEGSEFTPSTKYIITVYAKKDGYLDSEPVTQEIDVRGLKGDVNDDGEVDIADAVKIVNLVVGKIDALARPANEKIDEKEPQ
jgi:hypothetical protein